MLGANGSGKTTLLQVILGPAAVDRRPGRSSTGVRRGRGGRDIGYVQQQRRLEPLLPLRGRDVVRQGLDGHRWGLGRPDPAAAARVEAALAEVDALDYADMPVGLLSGGEQQRLRIAQALVADPALLLCDEPLLSLDPGSQRTITALVDRRRRDRGTAVLFVTHEINPVLPYVDRVLYLAGGRFRIGPVEEVLTSQTLSELYGSPVEVVRAAGQVILAGLPEAPQNHHAGSS